MPIGEETCSNRALMPSKKSNIAPMIMKSNARSMSPVKAKDVAIQPEKRLQQVMELGMWRVMKFAIFVISFWR